MDNEKIHIADEIRDFYEVSINPQKSIVETAQHFNLTIEYVAKVLSSPRGSAPSDS